MTAKLSDRLERSLEEHHPHTRVRSLDPLPGGISSETFAAELDHGLDCAQPIVHENRIRQAASSPGAAQFCIDASIACAKERHVFGVPLAEHQGIHWQPVELQTDAELIRNTVCGGAGYTRQVPFEHIYRHHRRHRITEGSDELQMRRIAARLFGLGRG